VIPGFQELLLSPALSSIPNGGEGVGARAIRAVLSFERIAPTKALLIPSPRSKAQGEGLLCKMSHCFIIHT
jgi:hypothetical protein